MRALFSILMIRTTESENSDFKYEIKHIKFVKHSEESTAGSQEDGSCFEAASWPFCGEFPCFPCACVGPHSANTRMLV